MNTAGNNKQIITTSILELIRKYANGEFSERMSITGDDDEADEIAMALNTLGEQMQAKTDYFLSNQKRIDEILEVLMAFTMSDFSKRALISDAGDELDAIAVGLNTLAEELDTATSKEQKYIHELESANKELKSFTHLASHDLREPLRNLRMFGSLIAETESKNLSERGKQLFEKIGAASARLENLIEALGAFSRIQSFAEEFKPVDLNDILKEIKMSHLKDIEAQRMVIESGTLPIINGLQIQLRQLFTQVIDNSVKYAKDGLPVLIKISAQIVPGNNIPVEGIDTGKNYMQITIEDNGIGFEQKYASRIFEIFQRLHTRDKYPGTGMGLALCKRIVHNHGGFIYAVGKEGEGAEFFICFPVK